MTREEMNRVEQMIDKVCRRFGFEVDVTLRFCYLVEDTNDFATIEREYKKIIK